MFDFATIDVGMLVARHLRLLFGLDLPKHVDLLRCGFLYDLSQFTVRRFVPYAVGDCPYCRKEETR